MADRDVSEVILASWTSLLRSKHVPYPEAVAREQLGIARAHGVRFVVPAHWRDPDSNALARPEPGDQQAGLISALAALGKGLCRGCGDRIELDQDGRIAWHEISARGDGHPPYRMCQGWKQLPHTAESLATAETGATCEPTQEPTDDPTDELEQY